MQHSHSIKLPAMSSFATERPIRFRITGKQSVERLEPLMRRIFPQAVWCDEVDQHLDFVWETTCEKTHKEVHANATILSRLHNTQVIESKANLAFLQESMDIHTIETYVTSDNTTILPWLQKRFECDDGWWVLKASHGNGGKDIWLINQTNYRDICAEVTVKQEYVLQRYVNNPSLYTGKKFHYRCYSMMKADMSSYVYHKAYILTAGEQYDQDAQSLNVHITNLSINKHYVGHPGQVPCDLPTERPQVYEQLKQIWGQMVKAAAPYMKCQRSSDHFEFFGLDLIEDASGKCWLVEANRLPGLESSNNNKEEEDLMYDTMMLELLEIVLKKLSPTKVTVKQCWDMVDGGSFHSPIYDESSLPMNILKWKMHTRSLRSKLVINDS